MFVSSCPHCGDSVTVPTRARGSSRVRCPLCTTEFTLDEMLAKLPPALELLDEPEEHFISAGSGEKYGSVGGDDGGHVALIDAESASDASVGEFGLAAAEVRTEKPSYAFDGDATAEGTPRKSISATPRPKKKAKSPLTEIIKVVLGGAAAIPVALLLFWYAFGKDPFEAGPVVAKYAPWIVPAKFQNAPEEAPKNEPANKQDTPKKTNNGNKSKKSNASNGDNKIPSLELGPNLNDPGLNTPPDTLPGIDPPGIAPPGIDPPGIDAPGGFDLDPVTPPAGNKKADSEEKIGTGGDLDKPKVPLSVANAPKYSAPEISEALNNANKALQSFEEGTNSEDADVKAKLSRALFKSLAELAEKVTFADQEDFGLTEQMQATRDLLVKLQENKQAQILIERVGPPWATTLSTEARGSNGVILIGTLQKPNAADQGSTRGFVLEDTNHTLVPLVMDRAQPEVRSIILGVVVEEPGLAMPGYVGDEDRIVFGDFALPFPKK